MSMGIRLCVLGSIILPTASCMSMKSMDDQRGISPEGQATPPIFKPSDFETPRRCTECLVELEKDVQRDVAGGTVSLEVIAREPGVIRLGLRVVDAPTNLVSIKGTIELVRDRGNRSINLPLEYRSYRPGDTFMHGERPCYAVNAALTSLIRFSAEGCASEGPDLPLLCAHGDECTFLVLSFDLWEPGDLRFKISEVGFGVREPGTESIQARKGMKSGGILRVRGPADRK